MNSESVRNYCGPRGAVSRGGSGVGFGDGAIDCHRDGGNCRYGYLWNNANFERPAKFDGHVRLEHPPSRRFEQWRKFELFGFDWHNRQSIFRKSPRAVCVSRFSAHLWPIVLPTRPSPSKCRTLSVIFAERPTGMQLHRDRQCDVNFSSLSIGRTF